MHVKLTSYNKKRPPQANISIFRITHFTFEAHNIWMYKSHWNTWWCKKVKNILQ